MRPKRDWEELVCAKLAGLAIEPRERREVIEELAAHLEESYESLRTKGLPEQVAMQQTLGQVADWQDLRRRIQVARAMKENIMNDRVRQLWLPGFLTFLLSTGLLAMMEIFGPKDWALMRVGQPPMVLFFIPWFFSLPLFGALGAYLSHRAGGSRRAIFSSIVFPVLPFLASILLATGATLFFTPVRSPTCCEQLRATVSSGGRREVQQESRASRWRSGRGDLSKYLW